jgi:TatA/E family protein of Tat protein translocase
MLSMPHLIVLFVVALVIFGPQKLPELARMLGKATAEFRKMTGDFRYALEEEVRELERQTRIREAEAAAAVTQPQPSPPAPTQAEPTPVGPEGSVPRLTPPANAASATSGSDGLPFETQGKQAEHAPAAEPPTHQNHDLAAGHDAATPAQEKPSDDNAAA